MSGVIQYHGLTDLTVEQFPEKEVFLPKPGLAAA